jgi:hypothetical protein
MTAAAHIASVRSGYGDYAEKIRVFADLSTVVHVDLAMRARAPLRTIALVFGSR